MDATETIASPDPSQDVRDAVDITFVIIGFNEAGSIGACLQSALDSALPEGMTAEVLYVDGGSRDASREIARAIPGVRVLGGDRPRRAAENRNVGLMHARGRFLQFVDGDMVLDGQWAATAAQYLRAHPNVGIVYGRLREVNPGRLFQAMQHDWAPVTGEVAYCGGAAMHRREVLEKVGGFPEDVRYGEEPYMCWRIRREQKVSIVQLESLMALHDLGHRSFLDYWRQHVRNGAAYIEIASRCYRSEDRLWLREVISIAGWNLVILGWFLALVVGPWPVRVTAVAVFIVVLARKGIHALRHGMPPDVSLVYAIHTYAAKLPLGWGVLKWGIRRLFRIR